MEVQLYLYDLSRGMARSMSEQFLGIRLEAIWHSSLVFGGIEYFFGAGVQACYPGTTHHGQPLQKIAMGTTELPLATILEYLEALKEVYTAESYDLFAHNCNNFSNDFAQFLVGRGIPDHVTNLPRRVLDTPFGAMLKNQIDASMRSITQAPVPQSVQPMHTVQNGATSHNIASTPISSSDNDKRPRYGKVFNIASTTSLDNHINSAMDTAMTIFFTSSTCAPCKMAYPMFDQLSEQHPQALFVKVDINGARDLAARYRIRATPTFLTFSRGLKQDEWTGADPNLLKANVETLLQHTFPAHPHTQVKVPTLQFGSLKPVTYVKVPPLDKLMAKLGSAAHEKEISSLRKFVEKRSVNTHEAPLPDMATIGSAFCNKILILPADIRFAAVDLLRCAMVDPRVSGYFAEEADLRTATAVLKSISEKNACPHNLRLVTIHLACNLFTSPLFVQAILKQGNNLLPLVINLVTSSLLDAVHPTTRVASASLAFNLAVANYKVRREQGAEAIEEGDQVELAASLVETLSQEQSGDSVKAILLALGYLVYCAPQEGELMELVKTLDAKSIVVGCKGQGVIAKEVALLL